MDPTWQGSPGFRLKINWFDCKFYLDLNNLKCMKKWYKWVSIHRDFRGIVTKTAQWMLNTVYCHWCIFCPQVVGNCNCMAVCWSSYLQHKLQLLWWEHIETNSRETTVCVFFVFFSGDWGLEVCGHGGGSYVPVDLRHRVCGGHPGLISPTCLHESHHSHSAVQLRQASYMSSSKACVPEDYYHQSCWHCDSIVRPRRQATENIFQGLSQTRMQGWCIQNACIDSDNSRES